VPEPAPVARVAPELAVTAASGLFGTATKLILAVGGVPWGSAMLYAVVCGAKPGTGMGPVEPVAVGVVEVEEAKVAVGAVAVGAVAVYGPPEPVAVGAVVEEEGEGAVGAAAPMVVE